MRLLVRIAVRETQAAWVERALTLSWNEFDREVATSEKGRPPAAPAGQGGLPPARGGVTSSRVVASVTWSMTIVIHGKSVAS